MQSNKGLHFYFSGIILARRSKRGHIHMQQLPFLAVCAIAALIPLVIGFIWYSKALFGNSWMRINRFRGEDMKGGNMALIFILTYTFSFMLTFPVSSLSIHQMSLMSIIQGDNSEAAKTWMTEAFQKYGTNFRTFKHGVLHGTMASIFFALPVIGIVALFERRGWKYILIHWGYWLVTLALMGGVLCQFIKLG